MEDLGDMYPYLCVSPVAAAIAATPTTCFANLRTSVSICGCSQILFPSMNVSIPIVSILIGGGGLFFLCQPFWLCGAALGVVAGGGSSRPVVPAAYPPLLL